jgi:hypothetical protein
MGQLLLDLSNRLGRIQVLGTDLGTVHNGVTTIQLEGIIDVGKPLGRLHITRVLNPTVRL